MTNTELVINVLLMVFSVLLLPILIWFDDRMYRRYPEGTGKTIRLDWPYDEWAGEPKNVIKVLRKMGIDHKYARRNYLIFRDGRYFAIEAEYWEQ